MTWTSGNPNVVSLSTDDPPILTALAAGHVTIVAGTAPTAASADVTVFAGPLPIGTVIWSNPGDGSGVNYIVPAVPSATGVADVFAFQADGTVQAITSDGTVAWTADLSQARYALPDFQGGLAVVGQLLAGQSSIYKLDGTTGQPYPAYTASGTASLGAYGGSLVAVHPDGTIFAVQQNSDPATYSEWDSVIGIDPTTGAQKFSVDLHSWPGFVWDIMIAGDGYAYVVSSSRDFSANTSQLYLLRVNSSGAYDDFGQIAEWPGAGGDILDPNVGMITNADQGILLTWSAGWGGMALTAGTGVSLVNPPTGPGGGVVPILQAQDGSFVGSYYNDMIAFDASGTARWIVANETPQIATADGGVIGQSGITYDQYGNATGQISLATQSWRGNSYTDGDVDQVVENPPPTALSLWAEAGGSPSGGNTAGRPWYFKLVWQNNCADQEFQWPNCGWAFYPDNPLVNDNLATSASSQAATIKSAALAAFKKAFDKWPVTANGSDGVDVSEGTPGTGDNRANVVDGYLMDSKTGTMACGYSNPFVVSYDSKIYFLRHMEQAQWALPIMLVTAQDVQNALGRADLMSAIGTGIGNTAAHELGHQFFLGAYGMDDNTPNTYNSWHCDGEKMPWAWGIGGPISWESGIAAQWEDMLRGGYHSH